LQGYKNMQNNRYWISENPHLTHKAFSIQWKLVSGVLQVQERLLYLCFSTKQLIAKNMYRSFLGNSFHS
jgi:hypothetical protein